MSFFNKREAEDIIPVPTKALSSSTVLADTDSYVLANGPASTGGGLGFVVQTDSVTWDGVSDFANWNGFPGRESGLDQDNFSVGVWLKPLGLDADDTIVQLYNPSSTANLFELSLRGDLANDPFQFDLRGLFVNKTYQFGSAQNDVWTYLAVTWDRAVQELKVYINGSEVSPTKVVDEVINTAQYDSHVLRIGPVGG